MKSGESMTLRLISASPSATATMYRALKFTFSTPVISPWTRPPMKSPYSSGALLDPRWETCGHGALADDAMTKLVT